MTRRVVTGFTPEGRSVVVSDEQLPSVELLPEYLLTRVWGNDAISQVPNDGQVPEAYNHWPIPGGHRLVISKKPAGVEFPIGGQFGAAIPGWGDPFEEGENAEPGMHASNTVDLIIVLSGETWCELDDGVEIHLEQGDVLIQNGTRHRWHNRGTVPCETAVVLLGAITPEDSAATGHG